MKAKLLTLGLITLALAGCGDYDNDEISSIKLTKDQIHSVTLIYMMNITCAAIHRYSNEVGSPIEGESYLANAKTARELLANNVHSIHHKKATKEEVNKWLDGLKTELYKAIIGDLNNAQNLQDFYTHTFATFGVDKNGKNWLGGASAHDCADVSAITRRVLDPIITLK